MVAEMATSAIVKRAKLWNRQVGRIGAASVNGCIWQVESRNEREALRIIWLIGHDQQLRAGVGMVPGIRY